MNTNSLTTTALITSLFLLGCNAMPGAVANDLNVSRSDYQHKLHGFWLGQSIANWTGIVTEMDKIGGEGSAGVFYTRDDWGKEDQPNHWGATVPQLSLTIDWVFRDLNEIWGSDDDTDIEYIYQHLLTTHKTSMLSGAQIRDGWLAHIYDENDSPLVGRRGKGENFLWVSNQRAHELMLGGLLPPATSDPQHNEHYDMIDAQLTTEIFGLFAPGRPDVALKMAHLPIRTTARGDAADAAEFYVVMHALASSVNPEQTRREQVRWMASQARAHLPDNSVSARMYDFVQSRHAAGVPWEQARDEVYQRYQIEQRDGYHMTSRKLDCNGCAAAGINFAASLVSLFYGEGDFQQTVKIAVLAGWDSDNPAATWGGLLGFMEGKTGIEAIFDRTFSERYNIHRTRKGFGVPNGVDNFTDMSATGLAIIDRVVREEMGGKRKDNEWVIPQPTR